jgi:O-antigen biosynthesis protein WbqP
MKRLFDFVLALLLAPFALVAVALLAVLVRLDSPGPAVFRQVRLGRGEAPFTCLKLRTMRLGTPDAPSHDIGASAVTGIGRLLRRSKLDELPQLWNILKGEMSFVGPRPCLPTQTALIAARRNRGLFTIRPGVTGVAQVAGVDMSDPERLAALDAEYLGNMSLGRDIGLILRTLSGAGRGDHTNAAT